MAWGSRFGMDILKRYINTVGSLVHSLAEFYKGTVTMWACLASCFLVCAALRVCSLTLHCQLQRVCSLALLAIALTH